jgi:hypothetical protein
MAIVGVFFVMFAPCGLLVDFGFVRGNAPVILIVCKLGFANIAETTGAE